MFGRIVNSHLLFLFTNSYDVKNKLFSICYVQKKPCRYRNNLCMKTNLLTSNLDRWPKSLLVCFSSSYFYLLIFWSYTYHLVNNMKQFRTLLPTGKQVTCLEDLSTHACQQFKENTFCLQREVVWCKADLRKELIISECERL